jgi:hypothetical protein
MNSRVTISGDLAEIKKGERSEYKFGRFQPRGRYGWQMGNNVMSIGRGMF